MTVFVDDGEGNVFGDGHGRLRRRNPDRDRLTGLEPQRPAGDAAVHQDTAAGDDRLQPGAAEVGHGPGQPPVQPLAGAGLVHGEAPRVSVRGHAVIRRWRPRSWDAPCGARRDTGTGPPAPSGSR